jgi:cytochrome c biogenesis protein CcmG, thiol:disulfide interchange protein DsbE
MNKSQRIVLYVFVLAVSAAWIIFTADPSGISHASSAPQVGFSAPDFTLQSLDGKTVTLSKLKGSAVLVNLWATWCLPCRAEMPAIEKMVKEYQDQGLVVLAVNMTYQDDAAAVLPFAQAHSLTFPILLDPNGLVGSAYQLRSLPSSYFINRLGLINEVVIGGPMAEALLRTRIEQILK